MQISSLTTSSRDIRDFEGFFGFSRISKGGRDSKDLGNLVDDKLKLSKSVQGLVFNAYQSLPFGRAKNFWTH